MKDESSIYNVKSQLDINTRLSNSLDKAQAKEIAKNYAIAYKVPGLIPLLPELKKRYPSTRLVIMRRNASDTFNSIMEKGWFSDESLEDQNLTWPNVLHEGRWIPYWVKNEDIESWVEMDELHRIAYYYLLNNGDISHLYATSVINYEEFIENPFEVAKQLAESLGTCFGPKTSAILDTVRRTNKKRDDSLLQGLTPEVRSEVEKWSTYRNS